MRYYLLILISAFSFLKADLFAFDIPISWEADTKAKSYQIEIYDSTGNKLLKSATTEKTKFTWKQDAIGVYKYRIGAMEKKEIKTFSQFKKITVTKDGFKISNDASNLESLPLLYTMLSFNNSNYTSVIDNKEVTGTFTDVVSLQITGIKTIFKDYNIYSTLSYSSSLSEIRYKYIYFNLEGGKAWRLNSHQLGVRAGASVISKNIFVTAPEELEVLTESNFSAKFIATFFYGYYFSKLPLKLYTDLSLLMPGMSSALIKLGGEYGISTNLGLVSEFAILRDITTVNQIEASFNTMGISAGMSYHF